jgi:hypothetical protein
MIKRRLMIERRRYRPPTAGSSDFQPAKTAGGRSRFLQIVAKRGGNRRRPERQPKLTRVAFTVSRLMEFCTKRELQNQIGHGVEEWPLVVLKELMDNALDACEESEVAPVISITVKPRSIAIKDNAGGIKPAPSSRSSTTASGCRVAKPTSRRPGAPRAMHSRPSSRWDTCSTASAGTAMPKRWG